MPVNYIVLAIPVFFALIALELVITRLQEKEYYSLGDSISDLGTGIVQQVLDVFLKTALFAGYLYALRRTGWPPSTDGRPRCGSRASWGWTSSTTGSTA